MLCFNLFFRFSIVFVSWWKTLLYVDRIVHHFLDYLIFVPCVWEILFTQRCYNCIIKWLWYGYGYGPMDRSFCMKHHMWCEHIFEDGIRLVTKQWREETHVSRIYVLQCAVNDVWMCDYVFSKCARVGSCFLMILGPEVYLSHSFKAFTR